MREQLEAQLSRFDDDAFAALANRGLLRRALKDLEKQAATVIEDGADSLTMSFGEHRIRFDAGGPAHAQCSCPASGVCQHVLAAAITLQRSAGGAAATEGSAGSEGSPIGELQAALMAISATDLAKHAGKAGYRWAWQFVEDMGQEDGLKIGGERHIVLSFSQPRISFRYMGGNVDSLIAEVDIAQIAKYRVAAVLAYQRANGLELTPPEPTGKPRSGTLDLRKDHSAAEIPAEALTESRSRLRESTRQLIGECVELGLAHLSRGIQERYATLAVWAQGAEYYRLALQMRRFADHVDLLLERAGGADEHRLFDELALAFGLVSALDSAAARNASPTHLVGQARTRYQEASALELLGLGASAWRSASGYVGLTMLFWSPADQTFLSCTDARPENQRGFNPVTRYKAAGPWGGLGAPAQATGRRVVLTGAQVNAAGRLSASESTSATVASGDAPRGFVGQLSSVKSWSEIMEARQLARRSLLAEARPMKDWVVLEPKRFGTAYFDGARQTLVWPLFDEDDNRLDLELAYGEYTGHAITRIEQLRADELKAGTLVVVHLRPDPRGLVGEPLSLVRPEPMATENAVDALHFDAPREQGFVSKWLERVGRLRASGDEATGSAVVAVSMLPSVLGEFRSWLQRQSERGLADDQMRQSQIELDAWIRRAADEGLTAFQRIVNSQPGGGGMLLQARYLCMQYERLIGGNVMEEAT